MLLYPPTHALPKPHDTQHKRSFGWTALYEAAGHGNRHVLERLVQAGANPKLPATVRFGFYIVYIYIEFLLGFGLLCVWGGLPCLWCGAGANPGCPPRCFLGLCNLVCASAPFFCLGQRISPLFDPPPIQPNPATAPPTPNPQAWPKQTPRQMANQMGFHGCVEVLQVTIL